MFANIKDKMHKQSTKGRKYSKEYGNLKNSFFLVKDRLICFLFILAPRTASVDFFLKLSRSGDRERNILLGCR